MLVALDTLLSCRFRPSHTHTHKKIGTPKCLPAISLKDSAQFGRGLTFDVGDERLDSGADLTSRLVIVAIIQL